MTITVLGAGRGKEKGLMQTNKNCPWVIAEEMIIMIRNLELHQTNYFENVLDFPTYFGEQQNRATI